MKPKSLLLSLAAALVLSTVTVNAQSIDNSGCCDVELPEPFAAIPKDDLIRALYPDLDDSNGMLGKDIRDKDGKKLAGQIYDAAIWKGWDDPKLLVLIETYAPQDGKRPETGATTYGLDLAAFSLEDGKPSLMVHLKNADTHSGHSEMSFDQAPYRITAEARAFGLRESYLHMGHRVETLKLFIPTDMGFKAVFDRQMVDSLLDAVADPLEGNLDADKMKALYEEGDPMCFDKQAVLHVVPSTANTNDFKVTEKRRERMPDGTLQKESLTEVWTWDDAQQAYVKKT